MVVMEEGESGRRPSGWRFMKGSPKKLRCPDRLRQPLTKRPDFTSTPHPLPPAPRDRGPARRLCALRTVLRSSLLVLSTQFSPCFGCSLGSSVPYPGAYGQCQHLQVHVPVCKARSKGLRLVNSVLWVPDFKGHVRHFSRSQRQRVPSRSFHQSA